mgnify:FL=1
MLDNVSRIMLWHIRTLFADNMNPDDILNIAMTGMLSVEHDMHQGFNDPGPLPSINTVFDAKNMY